MDSYQPRIRGVRAPQTSIPQAPQNNAPDSSGMRNATYETLQNTLQGLQTANQRNAQIAQQVVENIAGTATANSMTQMFNRLPRQRTGASSTDALMQFADMALRTYGQIEETRAQRRIQQEEAVRQQARAEAYSVATTKILPEATGVLQETGGVAQYRRVIDNYLNEWRPFLEPDDFVQLGTLLYQPVMEVQKQFAEERRRTVQEINDRNRDSTVAMYMIENSGLLSQIEVAAPEQQQQLITELNTRLTNTISTLSPGDASFVMSAVLEDLAGRTLAGTAAGQQAQQMLLSYQAYASEVLALQDEYNATGDLRTYQYNEGQLRIKYGISGEMAWDDPNEQMENIRSILSTERDINEMTNSGAMDAVERVQMNQDEIMSIAYILSQDASQEALLDAEFGENPQYAQAKYLAGLLRDAPAQQEQYTQQLRDIEYQIAQLQLANDQAIAGWMDTGAGRNSLSQMLEMEGIRSLLSAEEQALLEAHSQGQQVDPRELQMARQRVIDQRGEMIGLLQDQQRSIMRQQEDARRTLSLYGFDDPTKIEVYATGAMDRLAAVRTRAQEARQASVRQFGTSPNFSVPQLATVQVNGTAVPVPFRPGDFDGTGFQSNYGQNRDYYAAGEAHAGTDLAVPVGTDVVFYAPGEVIAVGEYGSYGNLIDIRTEDGKIHRFAHLSRFDVQQGDRVAPGQVIGGTGGQEGAPGSGRSSGPHLHWEIRSTESGYYNGSLDPLAEMQGYSSQMRNQAVPNGNQNVNVPAGAVDNGDGSYIQNGNVYRPDGSYEPVSYSESNPYRVRYASTNRADYGPNDGEGNFGYAPLANNRTLRLGIHRTASRLGIPAQWLADIMGFETGGTFDPSVPNYGGAPAVGLIQFYEDLNDPGFKTIGGRRYSLHEIGSMNLEQQLELVYQYFAPMRDQLHTPYHVLMAVWGGPLNLQEFINDPWAVRNMSDGDITFGEYTLKFGSTAGRQYTPLYEQPAIHSSFTRGCSTCSNIAASNTPVFAHESA